MRIVGGKFAGRDLTSPGKSRVRPTSEHVRASVLDYLRGDIAGARVLDLFAGTGALGLEAISRGAKYADFVEMHAASLHSLKANVARFKIKERTRVFVKDAIHFADALPPDRYDICFADPPYESKQLDWLIRIWKERRFSRILVVEHAATHEIPRGQGFLTFDGSNVTIYRRPAVAVPVDDPSAAIAPTVAEAPSIVAPNATAPAAQPPSRSLARSRATPAARSSATPAARASDRSSAQAHPKSTARSQANSSARPPAKSAARPPAKSAARPPAKPAARPARESPRQSGRRAPRDR